jgi:DNA ligase-4
MVENEDADFKVPDLPEDKDDKPEDTEQPDVDSALADWFKVEQVETPSTGVRIHENSDTETENDSDHDDLRPDEEEDEWLKVKPRTGPPSGVGEVSQDSDDSLSLFLISRGSRLLAPWSKLRYI